MKITEIYLETSKLNDLHDFYRNIIELKTENFSPGNISIYTKQTKIIFEKAKQGNPFYHFAFNIPANKIDEAFSWLRQKVELLWLPDYKSYIADFSNWNAKSVYFKDPAGNIVEFIARFDLEDNESVSFSSQQIRNVSEIGLVFTENNFDDHISSIITNYTLSYFSRQPPLTNFRAVGDNEGLFICVPGGRPWYPTLENNASLFPIRILFKEKGKKYSYCS